MFQELSSIEVVKASFEANAKIEISFRPERGIKSVEQVLLDVIETSQLIAKIDTIRDEAEFEKVKEIRTGIDQFKHFVFEGKFDILEAQVAGAKAAYLAAAILNGCNGDLKKFENGISRESILIKHPDYNYLNKRLKFVAQGEALFYWFQTVSLL